jgi:predicted O-methyltransferase YrrM
MNLTNSQRVRKLVINLAKNPQLIPSYIRYTVLNRKLPVHLHVPWWSFLAIRHADALVAGKSIFEFGTGGSTIRFSKVAKNVDCVEDDPEWAAIVQAEIARMNYKNVTVKICPFDFRNPDGFTDSDYLNTFFIKASQTQFDIVIIDGQDWSFRERITCFNAVEPSRKEGNLIIVDDFWRYTELLNCNRAKSVKVFESVGPCRLGVTQTAFFYY